MSETTPSTLKEAERPIREAIEAWSPERGPLRWSDTILTELARGVFAYQYAHNAPYRAFCDAQGVTPDTLSHWREIPAVATDVFKSVRLSVASATETTRTFRTSGTTTSARGEHHFIHTDTYSASLLAGFERFMLAGLEAPMPICALMPSAHGLPDSSLSFMMERVIDAFGDNASLFAVAPQADASADLGLKLDAIRAFLDRATASDQPVVVCGTAFAFVHLFDATKGEAWALPPDSRVMETGGFKGKSREVSRETLYAIIEERLGVGPEYIISEYSMTELSSQAYANTLPQRRDASSLGLMTAPWARIEVVDPVSFEILSEPGSVGLVRWFDLANTQSVTTIQTADRGRIDAGGGLVLLGRQPDSDLRGCSLTVEELAILTDSGATT